MLILSVLVPAALATFCPTGAGPRIDQIHTAVGVDGTSVTIAWFVDVGEPFSEVPDLKHAVYFAEEREEGGQMGAFGVPSFHFLPPTQHRPRKRKVGLSMSDVVSTMSASGSSLPPSFLTSLEKDMSAPPSPSSPSLSGVSTDLPLAGIPRVDSSSSFFSSSSENEPLQDRLDRRRLTPSLSKRLCCKSRRVDPNVPRKIRVSQLLLSAPPRIARTIPSAYLLASIRLRGVGLEPQGLAPPPPPLPPSVLRKLVRPRQVSIRAADVSCTYWRSGFHYKASLTDLTPGRKYRFQIRVEGEGLGTNSINVCSASQVASFHSSPPPLSPSSPSEDLWFTVLGDLGYKNYGGQGVTHSRNRILEEIKSRNSRMVIHAGDMGYPDNDFMREKWARKGWGFFYNEDYDGWMEWMKPIFDQVPYMVSVGNHEAECHSPWCLLRSSCRQGLGNFTAYNCKFNNMPGEGSGGRGPMWYSFDYGPIHFVSVNTETDFPGAPEEKYGSILGIRSGGFGAEGEYVNWLKNDLEKADKNREKVPWIVTFGHRPFYVLDGKFEYNNKWPEPDSRQVLKVLGPLVLRYSDLHITGHVHWYSRLLSLEKEIRPALVVGGGAGNDETPHAPIQDIRYPKNLENEKFDWFTYNLKTTISRLGVVKNGKKLVFETLESEGGEVVDRFELEKDNPWEKAETKNVFHVEK